MTPDEILEALEDLIYDLKPARPLTGSAIYRAMWQDTIDRLEYARACFDATWKDEQARENAG